MADPINIRDRIQSLVRLKASDLVPHELNHRIHPAKQKNALQGVLAEVGYVDALLVRPLPDGRHQIIDGHLRAETTPDAELPCLVCDLDDEEAKKVLATFDAVSALATFDPQKLDLLFPQTTFDNTAVNQMLVGLAKQAGAEFGKPAAIVEDEIPAVPSVPVTQPGDVWICGPHKLMCGDARKAEDIARLMGDESAVCVFTDPPYGVSIGAKNRLLNSVQKAGRNLTDVVDDQLTPEMLEAELLVAFVNLRELVMSNDCTLFVCSPQGCGLSMMMMMMQKAGLTARHVMIWGMALT